MKSIFQIYELPGVHENYTVEVRTQHKLTFKGFIAITFIGAEVLNWSGAVFKVEVKRYF